VGFGSLMWTDSRPSWPCYVLYMLAHSAGHVLVEPMLFPRQSCTSTVVVPLFMSVDGLVILVDCLIDCYKDEGGNKHKETFDKHSTSKSIMTADVCPEFTQES